MNAIYLDSVNPSNIPLYAPWYQGVLGYYNGEKSKWSPVQFSMFAEAGKKIARIDVNGTAPKQACILDVERFDATPDTASWWVPERNEGHGDNPDATVYASLSTIPAVVDYVGTKNTCYLIIADWDGDKTPPNIKLPENFILAGKQFLSTEAFDYTVFYDTHWLKMH